MTNQTNPVLTTDNAGQVFHAELTDWADQLYLGAYAEAYADAVVSEARGYSHNAEADLLPFLGEAADPGSDFFSEFIASQIPVYTDQLVDDWTAAGYPEATWAEGDIFEQIRAGLAEYVTDEVAGAIDELSELLADFQERYAAAEERERAEAYEEADETEAAIELERRGYQSNYLGMFAVTTLVDGSYITRVFDTATSTLEAVMAKEAEEAAAAY